MTGSLYDVRLRVTRASRKTAMEAHAAEAGRPSRHAHEPIVNAKSALSTVGDPAVGFVHAVLPSEMFRSLPLGGKAFVSPDQASGSYGGCPEWDNSR
jgi:hypothetical protein